MHRASIRFWPVTVSGAAVAAVLCGVSPAGATSHTAGGRASSVPHAHHGVVVKKAQMTHEGPPQAAGSSYFSVGDPGVLEAEVKMPVLNNRLQPGAVPQYRVTPQHEVVLPSPRPSHFTNGQAPVFRPLAPRTVDMAPLPRLPAMASLYYRSPSVNNSVPNPAQVTVDALKQDADQLLAGAIDDAMTGVTAIEQKMLDKIDVKSAPDALADALANVTTADAAVTARAGQPAGQPDNKP